ncbi:histone-arginine methyltransferase CARMER-like [Homarus americanus]|uniref:histone-arginine methyltransferase CARMER-like n=1 Tax=Homarus americanus TaxID=6706 RepID=UPI001C438BC9|nr:histone-arginine methyltransferase CARMER-like [Homarus americanus]
MVVVLWLSSGFIVVIFRLVVLGDLVYHLVLGMLVRANNLQETIQVIAGKIEEIDLPDMVDMIISEPMGYMLYNERMLETYLHAKKWLKPSGRMFPSRGDLHVAPFNDESLYYEQLNKANFWYQSCFHGVDLCHLREQALNEYLRQPIVDTFDIGICLAKSIRYSLDFLTAQEKDLHHLVIPLEFHILKSCTMGWPSGSTWLSSAHHRRSGSQLLPQNPSLTGIRSSSTIMFCDDIIVRSPDKVSSPSFLRPKMLGMEVNKKKVEEFQGQMETVLKQFETVWLKDQPFIAGNQATIADLLAACELEQPETMNIQSLLDL